MILYLGREWTGDLKKLPNIKLRQVSNKGLDAKNEQEEKRDAGDDLEDDEDDVDDEQLDEMVLMSDSDWGCLSVEASGQPAVELDWT